MLNEVIKKQKEPDCWSVAGLKERGWTDGSIKKFLGEPDKLVKNPYYSSAGAPMRLYLRARVEAAEQLNEFQDWFNKNKKSREIRSTAAKKVANKKRQELLEYINSIKIEIPLIETQKLYSKAISHYNNLWCSRGKEEKIVSGTPNEDFLKRVSVNMLRHEYSDYEDELSSIFGQVGVNEGYILLKNKVLQVIANTYPFLEEECKNQQY